MSAGGGGVVIGLVAARIGNSPECAADVRRALPLLVLLLPLPVLWLLLLLWVVLVVLSLFLRIQHIIPRKPLH